MNARRTIFLILSFASLLLAIPASAQSGRTCEYDLECPTAHFCNEMGRCAPRGAVETKQADDECGNDRRCRIDRLKRKNNARRHAQIIYEEEQVEKLLEEREEQRLAESPRLKDPISFDLQVSRLGPLGMHAGYVLFAHIQPEVSVGFSDLYASNFNNPGGSTVDGYVEGWWFKFGGSYFLLESWFSPYLSAGFMLWNGRYRSFSGFGFASSEMQARFHAGEFGGGIDLQLKFGLHTRLGMVYRPLVYNQARVGPGQYDPQTRQGLADWFNQAARIDVIWLVGWAF